MKCRVFEQRLAESALALAHGMTHQTRFIVTPDNIVLFIRNKRASVRVFNETVEKKFLNPPTLLGEIEVPKEMVRLARELLQKQASLDGYAIAFEGLTSDEGLRAFA